MPVALELGQTWEGWREGRSSLLLASVLQSVVLCLGQSAESRRCVTAALRGGRLSGSQVTLSPGDVICFKRPGGVEALGVRCLKMGARVPLPRAFMAHLSRGIDNDKSSPHKVS